ncbi:hypothetical protein JOF28_001771 [Leucobacter exalbidus]|uniref:DUF308 domain-containing protein n=1 Tax=Leucobacter exalbidus TaxID=662960 RepID=A0A940PS62_9MICO|nr:hypothetical protein [Leucobacter exalbidus]MBP1326539.1 hypothetical protein [Leucobacter exalbidus]
MTTAVSQSVTSVTPDSATPRAIRLTRVAMLLAVGMAITFTATQHERLAFDVAVTVCGLAGIALAHLAHAMVCRGRVGSGVALSLGIVSLAAAIAVPFTVSVVGYALVIAAWALISSLLEFLSAVVNPGVRQDTTIVGGAGILLALFTLLAREDPVAVVGFFGAYAIITGVFLGISAFDGRGAAAKSSALLDTNSPS